MVIRNALKTDVVALKHLLIQLGNQLSDEEVVHGISTHNQEGYHLMVAEQNEVAVGFISLHWFDLFHRPIKLGRISAFCVDERFRGQGIGIKLLEAAEHFLKSKGCRRIEVTSNFKRKESHQFYLNRGYVEDSRRFVKNE